MSSQRTFGCATNTGHPLSAWLAEGVLRTWVLLHVYLRCLSRGTCRPAPQTPDAHKQLVAEEQVSKFNSLQILTTNCLPSALLVEMSVAELTLFPASASRAALHDRTMSIARRRCCCRCPANSSAALELCVIFTSLDSSICLNVSPQCSFTGLESFRKLEKSER